MGQAIKRHNAAYFRTEAARLLNRSRDQHERLLALACSIESDGSAARKPPAAGGAPLPNDFATVIGGLSERTFVTDVRRMARDLATTAYKQQQLAHAMLDAVIAADNRDDQRVRVLVVDDSEDHRDLTAMLLERSGFHALTAGNGLEGLLAAHHARPAVILMDVTMPVLDGIEAARLLREHAVTRDLKMIAYTGRRDFPEGVLTDLFVDVLPKPANPEVVIAKIRRLIGSESSSPPMA